MSILAINAVHHIGGGPGGPTLAMRAPTFLPPVIFETHWTWWIAVIALGAILLFAARSRANVKMLRAGQGLLVLALVWMVAARSFETAGERLYAAHTALIAATEQADAATIVSYMDPAFTISAGEIGDFGITRDNARGVLTDLFKTISPKDMTIRAYQATLQPNDAAQSVITVFAKVEYPTLTTWRISWTDVPGADWRMISATHVSQEKIPSPH